MNSSIPFKIIFLLIVLVAPLNIFAQENRESDQLKHLELYEPARVTDLQFLGKGTEDKEYSYHRLEDFKGKLIVLNFWATWCVPCRLEMPSLDLMQKELKEDGHDVLVIAISEDFTGMPTVEKFYLDNKIRNLEPYIDDRNQLMGAFHVKAMPTTIFIDKSGKEVARVQGEVNWGVKKVREFVKSLL